ncbi:MAG: cytochrome d ubiquinol oxidase subunit II [Armatimonadota bacterium]
MPLELWIASVALAALIAYALLGGADFGGGIWNLLAGGPRKEEQRQAVAHAMGPVWEANHVWLIFLIVLHFVCFPPAFAAVSVALFVPFHLALIGIVLRGSAFVFRAHGAEALRTGGPSSVHPLASARLWGRIFGVASTITPFLLGMCLGAVSNGRLEVREGVVVSGYWEPWLTPFCWSLGALSLAICAYVAAVYLTLETEGETQEDFRRRALWAAAVMAALAALTALVARWDAPRFWEALAQPRVAPIQALAVVLAALSAWAVYRRRYRLGRFAAAGQVALVVIGWGAAQYPYLVYPAYTLQETAAPDATLSFVLWTLVPGGLLLIPSLALLFYVFKGLPLRQTAEE